MKVKHLLIIVSIVVIFIISVFVGLHNDMKMYENMAKRNIPKIDTDNTLKLQLLFAEQVEKELATIVESKGRKGNR